MRVKWSLWLGAMIVLAFLVSGAVAQKLPEIKYEKFELPNGLDVILHVDHTIPVISVNVWYHVGSKNEKPGRTGFAHLFEHLMFQGSLNVPTGVFDAKTEGAGGRNNGSTANDRTNYWENMPSNYLETTLWLESDRMGWLLPAITQERLDNQRDVVKNERRQGVDNEPYGKVEDLLLPMLYPPDHPYSWPVIGSMADLSAASLEDVKNFFKMYYSPNNASLCIAGDFDPVVARQLVEKYFGPIPPGPAIDRLTYSRPVRNSTKRQIAEDDVELPRIYMAWSTPNLYQPGDAEFGLLSSILTDGTSSRLYKALVYEQGIALDVAAFQDSKELCSDFWIIATARPGHSLDELEKSITAELKKVLTVGVTPAELLQAQNSFEAGFVRSLEPVGGFGGRADALNAYNTYLGDPNRFQWDLDRHLSATTTGIQQVAAKYLVPENCVILSIVPRGERTAADDTVNRAVDPGPTGEPSFNAPNVQHATLSNGLELYLVENHRLPVVQANLVFKGGWSADPAGTPGAASLTAELLDEGTKTKSSFQISDEARRLGASFGSWSTRDDSRVSLNVLLKNLDPALDLMADVVINPAFAGEELERQRDIYLGQITQEKREARGLADRAFQRLLFGAGHPYAQPSSGLGTESSIRSISRDDLVTYYQANYMPNNAAALVVGDITLADATARLERAFKKWQPGVKKAQTVAQPQSPAKTTIYLVDKPGAVQSHVMAGSLLFGRTSPDLVPFDVMNTTLGSQFTSRINQNLRERRGFTYGAYVRAFTGQGIGYYRCSAPVQSQSTAESVAEIVKEIGEIGGARPVTDSELVQAKANLGKSFPQSFESIYQIADDLGDIVEYGLPLDYWQTYLGQVKAVDQAKVTATARQYLPADRLLIVVVGDREKIEAGLKALNLGEVIIINQDTL